MTPPGAEWARRLGLLALAFMTIGACVFVAVGSRFRRPPTLDAVGQLIESRQFAAAEQRVRQYLQLDPSNPKANLLMAQVALDQEPQKPRLALDHLARIKTFDKRVLAHVRLNEGKAYSALKWNDRAEVVWKEALEFDPRIPEAGWNLLSLYYVEGRRSDAQRLALSLYATEPDPRDRARLLLELTRQDAQPITLDRLVEALEPVVKARPQDTRASIALALVYIRNSRAAEGLSILRNLLREFPEDSRVWDALLLGLDEARQLDELARMVERIPPQFAGSSRFERYRAVVAQERSDWQAAVASDDKAWRADPSDAQVLYRLSREFRAAGRLGEAERFDQKVGEYKAAKGKLLSIYKEAAAERTLGIAPHPDLYHRLAEIREHMGREDEALEWHRLVLEGDRTNPISLAAERRLIESIKSRTSN